MRMPNAERAIVALEKLRDYCLSTSHRRGRHKARVFATALGITAQNAQILREALQQAANSDDTIAGEQDRYGQRYMIDFALQGPAGAAAVRSHWIVRRGEDFPRLTSCHVL